MKNKTNILDSALKISSRACESAEKDFGLEAGFYGMRQEIIDNRQCLVVSIILSEPLPEKVIPKKIEFIGQMTKPGLPPGWKTTTAN